MIDIKFFDPDELDKNLKVTIHRTGKMGFTSEAARKLGLADMRSANIGINAADPNDKSLYLEILKDINDGKFRVSKAGAYYYINTKILFDNLQIDYSKGNVTYDMTQVQTEKGTYYKLQKREQKGKVTEDNK